MTDRVQFREDPKVVAYVAARGVNPNELARRAFEEAVRRMKVDETWSAIQDLGLRFDADEVTRAIREDRDSR